MNNLNVNKMNSILAWISMFAMGWFWIFNIVPMNSLSIGFFIWFLIIAWFSAGFERYGDKK